MTKAYSAECTAESPVVLQSLRKEYGDFVAVNNLSLKVKRNSFTGLLGPNGAGKSTSLKILTNLIHPTSGHAYLNGYDVTKQPKKALTGVGTVVETPEFYLYLTPRETFDYIGEIYGMSKESISNECASILDEVKMTDWADKKLGTFSKGMRQRVAIGLSLMNEPNIIILDEPTSGLDPRGMAEMRDILKNIRNGRKDLTVLMSSHMMHEVSDLCDNVAFIEHGTMIKQGTLRGVLTEGDLITLHVKVVGGPTENAIDVVSRQKNVESAERWGDTIRVKFRGSAADEATLFSSLATAGIGVYSLSENENALEDTYLNLVKESR